MTSSVAASRFTADGRPLLTDLGNTYGAVVSYRYEHGTIRLEGIGLDRERINGTELNLNYTYDQAGNVTRITDAPTSPDLTGAGFQDNQCFSYDGLARLQTAWTAGNADCTRRVRGCDGRCGGTRGVMNTHHDRE